MRPKRQENPSAAEVSQLRWRRQLALPKGDDPVQDGSGPARDHCRRSGRTWKPSDSTTASRFPPSVWGLHQALPSAFGRTLEAYRALETLLDAGKVRAIGVSNFMVEHLATLLERATVVPAVNQIEVHPYFAQRQVQDFGAEHGIVTQAWSPIGGITFYRDGNHGSTLEDPVIGDLARAHGKTSAQVMLRWGLHLVE